jgi:hypothetical protein
LVAIGPLGLPALHAAALEPGLFAGVTIRGALGSWAEVVGTPLAREQYVHAVHAALRVYDLPELAAAIPPDRLQIVEPVDALGQPAVE